MSAVINCAKQRYLKAFKIQLVLIGLMIAITQFWQPQSMLSVLSGSLIIFIAHYFFVYWVFFRKLVKQAKKMTAFYQGEGIKWFIVVSGLVVSFLGIPNFQAIPFFAGYFITLLLNNLIPMWLSKQI